MRGLHYYFSKISDGEVVLQFESRTFQYVRTRFEEDSVKGELWNL